MFNGANTTGNVTVGGSGVLGGTGMVTGAVTVNSGGHLSPGASIESLGVGSLTLNAGAVLDFEIGAGGAADLINVAGVLDIAGGTVNLTDLGGMTAGLYTLLGLRDAHRQRGQSRCPKRPRFLQLSTPG